MQLFLFLCKVQKVSLFIPPLTQLNTPYPATAYLTGFLKSKGVAVSQADLGLDLVLQVYSKEGFAKIFDAIEQGNYTLSPSLDQMVRNRSMYERVVDDVIAYLQQKSYTLAYRIASRSYLPEGARFQQLKNHDSFFGSIGVQDKARYFCTLFLEDVADLIQATVGPHFGFSKYAERIARTATSFDPLQEALHEELGILDEFLWKEVENHMREQQPTLVGFTVPFGGNLYGALKASQFIKKEFPHIHIAMGGGYVNTELRDITETRLFDYVDYLLLDDGEAGLEVLLQHLDSPQQNPILKRTFIRKNNQVVFIDNASLNDYVHKAKPAPTYEGLRFNDYLSVIDMPNAMHRLWNDGRWNKLTVAHGCYWKKCTFCDITLDYIGRYDGTSAAHLVDLMEEMIRETGETGFHFVDEAAPPAAMRDMALEILKRNLTVSWWANIRFEKSFTPDLSKLLAASGCIAVTGGLEVASPRILELIDKGISIDQVARVCKGFRDAGILVHAYLMYGFPTQTDQETIDSLEVVRQLFKANVLHSAHWHQFAMTAHSPVGKDPEKFGVIRTGPEFKGFANNDLFHDDPKGAKHENYSDGLKKALYNYMHGVGIDFPLSKFFSFGVAKTMIHPALIEKSIKRFEPDEFEKPNTYVVAEGVQFKLLKSTELLILARRGYKKLVLPDSIVNWLLENQARLSIASAERITLKEIVTTFSQTVGLSEEKLVQSDWWKELRNYLWVVRL